jgi:hypothetical protein
MTRQEFVLERGVQLQKNRQSKWRQGRQLHISRGNTGRLMAAVVVYAIRDGSPIFFIGKESRFLRDLIGRESTECHTFNEKVTTETMRTHFTNAAKTQSDKVGFRVQYDTPQQDLSTLVAKTHFRYLPEKGVKYGIVKGGMETVDNGSTINTAVREFNEECMNLAVNKTEFQRSKTHISSFDTPLKGRDLYFLDITCELATFETSQLSRLADHYGELFDSVMMKGRQSNISLVNFHITLMDNVHAITDGTFLKD